jgi:adhesin transport system membrane fusion protein
VEVLRLQRQKSDLELKLTDVRSQYYVQAREALSKANAEVDMVSAILKGRQDSVTRLTVKSPVRGIVKNIKVTTIGGVIPPNGELMEIVPVDDHLLIETRLSPRDIAFIHPNQEALVKITAYDYAIYGGLHGGRNHFRTPSRTRPSRKCSITGCLSAPARITWSAGRHFSIVPGMIATVDIKTGEKTVLDYLIKPFNRAKEALRER